MRQRATIFTAILLLVASQTCFTQWGGVSLNTPESYGGYTFFGDGNEAYLVDNCGGLVNEWSTGFGSYHPKILSNGNLLFLISTGVIEKDWNNNVVNQVSHGDFGLRLKYEVELLPNGNYLCVGRRNFSTSEFMEIGYDLRFVSPSEVDVVLELDRNTGEIVWEWKISDHVIQQRDTSIANYGVLSENPQLLNMGAISQFDWTDRESFMINGMDYNPTLDQIVLSVRKMSEFVIIDHSTTTEEAEGHSGGIYGKGGDILYRWGNPQNYDRGTSDDRILYFQHNPNWITEGELEGNIICYNNGLNRPGSNRYSTVPIIRPPLDEDGNYLIEDEEAFLPALAPYEYSEVHTSTYFYSSYTSGAQYLPNGNIYITEGVDGRLLEIDPTGKLVWEYTVPLVNYLFRSERYSEDYIGFDGKDLTPNGLVPFDSSIYDCNLGAPSNTSNLLVPSDVFKVNFDITNKDLKINNAFGNNFSIRLYSMQGQALMQQVANSQFQNNLGHLPAGMYIMHVADQKTQVQLSQKIVIQ